MGYSASATPKEWCEYVLRITAAEELEAIQTNTQRNQLRSRIYTIVVALSEQESYRQRMEGLKLRVPTLATEQIEHAERNADDTDQVLKVMTNHDIAKVMAIFQEHLFKKNCEPNKMGNKHYLACLRKGVKKTRQPAPKKQRPKPLVEQDPVGMPSDIREMRKYLRERLRFLRQESKAGDTSYQQAFNVYFPSEIEKAPTAPTPSSSPHYPPTHGETAQPRSHPET